MQNLKLRLKLGWCWKICRARLAKMIDVDSICLWNFTACIYSYRNMSWIDILLNMWTIYRYACNVRDVVISWLLRCVTDGSWGVDGVRMGRWATETAGPRAPGSDAPGLVDWRLGPERSFSEYATENPLERCLLCFGGMIKITVPDFSIRCNALSRAILLDNCY